MVRLGFIIGFIALLGALLSGLAAYRVHDQELALDRIRGEDDGSRSVAVWYRRRISTNLLAGRNARIGDIRVDRTDRGLDLIWGA